MTEQPPRTPLSSESAPGDLEAHLDEVRDAVVADPELAEGLRTVLHHLAVTPIDPTGAPE